MNDWRPRTTEVAQPAPGVTDSNGFVSKEQSEEAYEAVSLFLRDTEQLCESY